MANENVKNQASGNGTDREALLKSYLKRLNDGEDLETIRAEFVENFRDVSINEIVAAEQDLIKGGVPFQKVQKLCDIHSALFHGKTENEVLKAEQAAFQQLQNASQTSGKNVADKTEMTDEQKAALQKNTHANLKAKRAERMANLPKGHPLRQLMAENRALEKVLDEADKALSAVVADSTDANAVKAMQKSLQELKKVRALYSRKEELLMPRLEEYGITGPTVVMWGADDDIKADVRTLANTFNEKTAAGLTDHVKQTLQRIREMIYKEDNILYPLAAENLTDEQWYEVYGDLPEMGEAFLPENEKTRWPEAEQWMADRKKKSREDALANGRVHLDGGELTVAQLNAIFAQLPIDVTFADEEEINRFFLNEGHVFARPKSALGRKLYSCHPQQILPMVKQMIADFKSHKRDHLDRWIDRPGNPIKVSYRAVYAEDGSYLGTLELVQQFGEVTNHLESRKK